MKRAYSLHNQGRAARHAALAMLAFAAILPAAAPRAAQSQVPAGTRFVVELDEKLDAQRIRASKKFEARTVEPLTAADGSSLPAGTKLRGEVVSLRENEMTLRLESVDTPGGPRPLAATVKRIAGDASAAKEPSEKGNDKSSAPGAHKVPPGAGSVSGLKTFAGKSAEGVKWFFVGGPDNESEGTASGAKSSNKLQILEKGTRLEVQLDQPFEFQPH